VFADDPGSAVLTLTSFGLARRCRPRGLDPSPVIALWREPTRGAREVPLEPGAQGVLVTACMGNATRRSADGRWPADNATDLFDVAVYQVHAAATALRQPDFPTEKPAPPLLETGDLTILTGWAEGVAEALATVPERALALLADARPGASWRAGLGIPPPSPRLSEAIERLDRSVRAGGPPTGPSAFGAVLAATTREDQPGEQELDALARRVLRSALEQLRVRHARDTNYHQAKPQ
jgi:hypothetical protein